MPIYEYRCPQCGVNFTAYKKLKDYKEPQSHACGTISEKVISPPMVAVDYPAYESPVTGKIIEGKRAHQEELKRTGCRLLEPGEQKDIQRRKAESEKQLERKVDASVEQIFSQIKG